MRAFAIILATIFTATLGTTSGKNKATQTQQRHITRQNICDPNLDVYES